MKIPRQKLTLKTGNNILKLMGKANQARDKAKKEINQLYKDSTFALPSLPANSNDPSTVSTYCQIIPYDQSSENQNINKKINYKIRHSSLTFLQDNHVNEDSKFHKKSNQMNSLANKYSFLEILQSADLNYFIKKIFQPEIALFMNGANKVICVISQDQRKKLDEISKYIIATNQSLESEKQRTYEVKLASPSKSTFELSERVDFSNSPVSVITPNSPPFSYLFVLNLLEEKEVTALAQIVRQLKSDKNDKNEFKNSITTNYAPFRQICQICKKNCSFSVVLFIGANGENGAEKLANLFCEKKKTFFISSEKAESFRSDRCKRPPSVNEKNTNSDHVTNAHQDRKSGNIKLTTNSPLMHKIDKDDREDNLAINSPLQCKTEKDDREDNLAMNSPPETSAIDEEGGFHDAPPPQAAVDDTSLMLNRAESDLIETQSYVSSHTDGLLRSCSIRPPTTTSSTSTSSSSLFDLLKTLNSSERESRSKLEKLADIRRQLSSIAENLAAIRARRASISDESASVVSQLGEVQRQSAQQRAENERMKANVREMIVRTGRLRSKYSDLLSEVHARECELREKQWKAVQAKEREMRLMVAQSETKWRKELEGRRRKENEEEKKENKSVNGNEMVIDVA